MTPSSIRIDCPCCSETLFRWRFEKKGRSFWQCRSCGMEKQHPLPTPEELKDYYEQSYSEGMYQTFAAATQMKRMTARRRLYEIKKQVDLRGPLLDVGCANGIFVETAIQEGIEAEGVELSENAVSEGRDRGLRLTAGTIEDVDSKKTFQTITAFDVLEHVLDPRELIQQMASRLEDHGLLVLTLPNRRSWPAILMGSRWYFYIPEEHLHYFDPSNLPKLLKNAGLQTIRVGRTYKPLTLNYSLTQFQEYNPWIYTVLSLVAKVIPHSLRERILPLAIGEMMVVAKKVPSHQGANTSENRVQQAAQSRQIVALSD